MPTCVGMTVFAPPNESANWGRWYDSRHQGAVPVMKCVLAGGAYATGCATCSSPR